MSYKSKIFDKEDLRELLLNDEHEINGMLAKVVENTLSSTTRWSHIYEMVFSYDGKFYMTDYSTGATEQQDEQPFEYSDEKIECIEVVPVEVKTIKYVAVS